MIAQSAIQPGIRAARLCRDYTGEPRLGKKMPPEATLPFLRAWYNDHTLCNPKRMLRFALLRRDYTGSHGLESKCRVRGASFPARVV